MKRKFLILTLCFTIIFSSINYKKSYADGGIISAPILATVVTTALGTGIVLKNKEEIYNMGRLFYDYVKNHNSIIWDTVVSAFESSVAFKSLTKQVIIGEEFGGILKGFFDDTFGIYDSVDSNSSINLGYYKGYPDITGYYSNFDTLKYQRYTAIPGIDTKSMSVGEIRWFSDLYYVEKISQNMVNVYNRDGYKMFQSGSTNTSAEILYYTIYYQGGTFYSTSVTHLASKDFTGASYSAISSGKLTLGTLTFGLNYDVGTYNPGNVWGDTEEGLKDVPIYVPGNLGDILNGNPGEVVGDKAPGWVGNGTVSVPSVDNPSIGVSDDAFVNSGVVDKPTDTPTDKPTDTPSWLPSFPSFGEELDFSPLYMTNIKDKFPFSLPWDFKNLINMFDVDPVAPKFEVPFLGNNITLDFSYFEEWATIIRFFILISFNVTLIFISTKLKG